jgi:hypothetical protein
MYAMNIINGENCQLSAQQEKALQILLIDKNPAHI